MKDIEWSEDSLDDMSGLDKEMARRVKQAVERFAETGAGSVKRLQGIKPPEFRLRVGDYRVIYEVQEEASTVIIVLIADRREAYE